MKTESWDDERTLISVEHDGQTAMLRVESASNPSKVRDALVRPFPEIGAAGHTRGLINAVVNTNPREEDQSEDGSPEDLIDHHLQYIIQRV